MKYNYKRIDLKTKKDFDKAEKLQEDGWYIILIGVDYLLLEKKGGLTCKK